MVLHKNKWDKKATRKHEKKLGAKGVEEERGKATVRRGTKAPQAVEAFPALPEKKATGEAQEKRPVSGSDASHDSDERSGGEEEEREEGNGSTRRKRVMQSNAWRYEEPEPEPGEVSEESDHADDEHLEIAREKLKGIEERETKDEELNSPVDIKSDPNELKRYKGSVVVVARDEFKDVSEKIRKQKLAEDFRRRFGSPQSVAAASKRRTTSREVAAPDGLAKHEEDLDDILGNMGI